RAHGRLKSRVETELAVDSARAAAEMLTALGYLPALTFEKRRVTWELDGCLVELDTLPHLGDYVEIEGESDEQVLALRDRLGLADVPVLRASYIPRMTAWLRENPRRGRVVGFEHLAVYAGATRPFAEPQGSAFAACGLTPAGRSRRGSGR